MIHNGKRYDSAANGKLAVGVGVHYIWFYGRLIRINHSMKETEYAETLNKLTITKLGRSKKLIQRLIDAITAEVVANTGSRVFVYTRSWYPTSVLQPRNLDSVILEHNTLQQLITQITKFNSEEHKEWCIKRGIPYRLGIMLYGPPGTGKTSLIRALSTYFDRNLYMLSFEALVDLQNALTDSDLSQDGIFVIEDIDHQLNRKNTRRKSKRDDDESISINTSINMSDFLNAVDGVTASVGRILIITTNSPDELPEALLRPGRIDIQVKLDYFDDEMLGRFTRLMYDEDFDCTARTIKPEISGAMLQTAVVSGMTLPELVKEFTLEKK